MTMARQNDDGLSLVFANVFAATKCLFLEQNDAAQAHAQSAYDGALKMGFSQWSAQARMQLARLACISGDETALADLLKAREDYMSAGMVLARPYLDLWIADAQAQFGQAHSALETLESLTRYSKASGQKYYLFAAPKAQATIAQTL